MPAVWAAMATDRKRRTARGRDRKDVQDPQGLHAAYTATDLEAAAQKIGVRVIVVPASVENDLDVAFAKLVDAGVQGLVLNADATFFGWQNRLVSSPRVRFRQSPSRACTPERVC